MIVFCEANGQVTSVLPSPVYQGSALSGGLYFLAPFPKTDSVTVAFELPDGTVTDAYLLTPVIEGLENVVDTFGEKYSVWEWQTSNKKITAQAGTVTAQFYVGYSTGKEGDSEFQVQASATVSFTVQKGVILLPTETPSADQWDTLITLYSDIKGTLDKIDNINGKVATVTAAAIATEGYAQKAHDSEIEAAKSESNALTYKNEAETAKDTATAKAREASESATNSAKSATNANTSAFSALDQANRAQSLADSAKNNADNATTQAGLAQTYATNAAKSATEAEEAAQRAVNAADGKVTTTPNSIVKRDSAGRVKTADAVSDEDATSYGQHKALRTYTDSELLKKLDRTGGTITGNLIVSGNLSVSGEASVIESTTLKVADKLIYIAKDNTSALTSPAGLITPKYDGTNDGGLVYDNSGTAYVGDIKLDSNGNVDVNASDLQPIATRDAYSNFTNGHKVKAEVDSSQKSVKFIDGGQDDGINSLINADLTFSDTTVHYDATNGIQLTSTGRFTYAGGNHDATIDLDLPIVGKDGIVIDKAADSEKIEVSGKNFRKALKTEAGQWKIYASKFGNPNDFFWAGTEVLSDQAVVVRGNNGCIYTNMPNAANTKDTTVPNKKYLEDNFTPAYSSSLPVLWGGELICYNNNKYGRCSLDSGTREYTAVLRDDGGQINLPEIPANDYNAVCKKYVDDAIANISSAKTLYRHDLRITRNSTSSVFGYSVYCSFYASSNLNIASVANLRTVVGNQFTLMATGYLSGTNANYDPVEAIFQSGVRPIKNNDQTYDNATFSDDVTKII